MKRWIYFFIFSVPLFSAYPKPIEKPQAMVTTSHPLASKAGERMLKVGGNAVDAAVAAALVVSTVEPYSAGIGGGGFLLLKMANSTKIRSLDFREKAPKKASRDMYLRKDGTVNAKRSIDGHWSIAIPGTIAGLHEVHKKYAKLPWASAVKPALDIARDGFEIGQEWVDYAAARKGALFANAESKRVFGLTDKKFKKGMLLKQPDLAQTLQRISHNPRDFYEGITAKLIEEDMKAHGGLIRLDDLKAYRVAWREPICGKYRGYEICSMPPPSSGGIALIEMLNMTSLIPIAHAQWHNTDFIHLKSEIMRTAYADRAEFLGDPAFFKVPTQKLLSAAYAKKQFDEISKAKARSSLNLLDKNRLELKDIAQKYESNNTAHLNVVDAEKNTVSMTFTVNYLFGSGVVAQGTGILMNNEMDDFSAAPGKPNAYGLVGGRANSIAPGKIPLSSMSPLIGTLNGKLAFAAGTPGGSRIITTMYNFLLNYALLGMDVSAAIASPRIHHQWLPDKLWVEDHGLDPATLRTLRQMGHDVEERRPWSNANAIAVESDGSLVGSIDPRGHGSVAGF